MFRNGVVFEPSFKRKFSFPDIQRFAVLELGAREPLVSFRTFVLPTYEVLEASSFALLVDDLVNERFDFTAVINHRRCNRFGAGRELAIIILLVTFELRGVKGEAEVLAPAGDFEMIH